MGDAQPGGQQVHLDEDFEREGWAAAFGVSVEELVAATKVVGLSVEALRDHLCRPEGSATMF
jgi:hypothetical protein